MRWTAIVPLKQGPERKSRLAKALSAQARAALSDRMARHVLVCLGDCPSIERVILLSPAPLEDCAAEWRRDGGQGLNRELADVRADLGPVPVLVIHGDLPCLEAEDVEALIEAAGHGIAIAPDRHETGTNALAIADGRAFPFAFGADSFARHKQEAGPAAAIVSRPGLALDIDTPDDLEFVEDLGCC